MTDTASIEYCPSIEVIDAIEAWKLGFHLGNVVQYVASGEIDDLYKAVWHINREIRIRKEDRGVLQRELAGLKGSSPDFGDDDDDINDFARIEALRKVPLHLLESSEIVGVEVEDGRVLIVKDTRAAPGYSVSLAYWLTTLRRKAESVLIRLDGEVSGSKPGKRAAKAKPDSTELPDRIVACLHDHAPRRLHVSEIVAELEVKPGDRKMVCHWLSRLTKRGTIYRFSRGVYGARASKSAA